MTTQLVRSTSSDKPARHQPQPEMELVDPEGMCPQCVTPWKCNGPHKPERRPTGWEVCSHDGDRWPCDYERERQRAEALEAVLRECESSLEVAHLVAHGPPSNILCSPECAAVAALQHAKEAIDCFEEGQE